ncbi:MAG TPA: hypothetical protein VI387_00360, partial [Candidatus Brocadiales bacterium]|nr:hypothetical protein [Candidatus Brocadiales bacterium]
EISAASQEQAEGVNQINTAVNQMDTVTQQNASSAEESAAASEELSAQAESLTGIVDDLTALVGIEGRTNGYHKASKGNGAAKHRMANMITGIKEHATAGKGSKPSTKQSHQTAASKEDVIPMGDDAFKGF